MASLAKLRDTGVLRAPLSLARLSVSAGTSPTLRSAIAERLRMLHVAKSLKISQDNSK